MKSLTTPLGESLQRTPHQPDQVAWHITRTSRNGLLPAEELFELIDRANAGDMMALSRILDCNQGLVLPLAGKYSGPGVAIMDLIQEGNLGLLEAIERFDKGRGCAFSTYALWRIRERILQFINQQSRIVRLPEHIAKKQLSNASRQQIIPFDERISTTGEEGYYYSETLGDVRAAPPYTVLEAKEELAKVQSNLKLLVDAVSQLKFSDRDVSVFFMRYGLAGYEKTNLREVAQKFGFSRQNAQQIVARVWKHLRGRKIPLSCENIEVALKSVSLLEELTY